MFAVSPFADFGSELGLFSCPGWPGCSHCRSLVGGGGGATFRCLVAAVSMECQSVSVLPESRCCVCAAASLGSLFRSVGLDVVLRQHHTKSVWVSGPWSGGPPHSQPGGNQASGSRAWGLRHRVPQTGGGDGVSAGVLKCWPPDCTHLGYGHCEHVCTCRCKCVCEYTHVGVSACVPVWVCARVCTFGFGSGLLGFGRMRVKRQVARASDPREL